MNVSSAILNTITGIALVVVSPILLMVEYDYSMSHRRGKMPKPNNLFATPTGEELQKWIERHSTEDQAHLWTAAMMGWNMACKASREQEFRRKRRIRKYRNILASYIELLEARLRKVVK